MRHDTLINVSHAAGMAPPRRSEVSAEQRRVVESMAKPDNQKVEKSAYFRCRSAMTREYRIKLS
jgi:hypothetical protein